MHALLFALCTASATMAMLQVASAEPATFKTYSLSVLNKDVDSDERWTKDPPARFSAAHGEIYCGFKPGKPFSLNNAAFEAWDQNLSGAVFGGGSGNGTQTQGGHAHVTVQVRTIGSSAPMSDTEWRRRCNTNGYSVDHVKIDHVLKLHGPFTGCKDHLSYTHGKINGVCFVNGR